jgi:hypothetical protein
VKIVGPHRKRVKTRIAVLLLITVGVVIAYAYRRSSKRRDLDEVYAELKALPPVAKDFTTPEGAILCLEDAYRRHDIEAAIAAKDFKTEARLMLINTGFKDHIDDEMISKTAEALVVTFRAYTTAQWPGFDGLEPFFTKREPYADKIVVVTEVCRFPDHGFSTQRLLVSETTNGWRVLNLAPK